MKSLFCMHNNRWEIIGDQLPTKSPFGLRITVIDSNNNPFTEMLMLIREVGNETKKWVSPVVIFVN